MVYRMSYTDAMRILVAEETGPDFRPRLATQLAERGLDVELGDVGSGPADALVVGGWEPEADVATGLAAGVRWIQTLITGVDHVLVPAVVDSEVVVTNSAGATAPPVAELAFARMLEHAKQLPTLGAQQQARLWHQRWLGTLYGKRLLVVGLGAVGLRIAELGRAFGMHVTGIRRRPAADLPPCHAVHTPEDLHRLLGEADFITLVPALTPQTRGMIGAAELNAIDESALLINLGRGELIEHEALLQHARQGRVRAALDVFPEEPLPPEHPLWECPGIRISPHNGALAPLLLDLLVDLVADNIERFVLGNPLNHVIDKTLGYPRTD